MFKNNDYAGRDVPLSSCTSTTEILGSSSTVKRSNVDAGLAEGGQSKKARHEDIGASQSKKTRSGDIELGIHDYPQLLQTVMVAASITDQLQLIVYIAPLCTSETLVPVCSELELRGMNTQVNTCFQAKWVVQASQPILPAGSAVQKHGPFFMHTGTLCSALKSKGVRGSGQDDCVLVMHIAPLKNKIKLSYSTSKPTVNGYLAEEKMKLIDGNETDTCVDNMVYPHQLKLKVSDISNVFQNLHDNKYVDCQIALFTNSSTSSSQSCRYAVCFSASSVLRSSRYTFFHTAPSVVSNSDDSCEVPQPQLFESNSAFCTANMELKFIQTFTVAKLHSIFRAMKEHFMFISLAQKLPLCIRYNLATTSDGFSSYIMCFICSIDDGTDEQDEDESPSALPPPPTSERDDSEMG